MSNDIRYIKKIEIKDLWGRFDFVWNLNADVNVLGGANGTGKSTILECVYNLLRFSKLPDNRVKQIEGLKVTFNNDCTQTFVRLKVNGERKILEDKAKTDSTYKQFMELFKEKVESEGLNYRKIKLVDAEFLSNKILDVHGKEIKVASMTATAFIKTFDRLDLQDPRFVGNELINTDLDKIISHLQNSYLDYQLKRANKISDLAAQHSADNIKEIIALRKPRERFLEIIDDCFKHTGKKVDRSENRLVFKLGEQKLTTDDLSSGEKQLLIILLTTLIAGDNPQVLFMDEPEISLHSDWQEKLIQYIRELNPNCQIILATHSPTIIMDGWLDKVAEISDLITRDKLAPNKVSHAQ